MKVTNLHELNYAMEEDIYNQVGYVRNERLDPLKVINEDKSVKWNREEVLRLNDEMKAKVESNRKERRDMSHKQDQDIIRAYSNDSGLSEEKVGIIYNYAYSESHASGINEVIQTMESLIELVQGVNKG